MPRKTKKVEAKKQEKGLQRLDTLFHGVKAKDGKLEDTKQNERGTDNTPIVLSDDDGDSGNGRDGVCIELRDDHPISIKQEKAADKKKSFSNSSLSSASHDSATAGSISNEASSSSSLGSSSMDDFGFSTKRGNECSTSLERAPLTNPFVTKKLKSEQGSFLSANLATDFDSSSSSTQSRQIKSCPVTPTKRPPQRNAWTSPSKRWKTSPFSKYPIRKAHSSEARFKSLEHRDPYYLTNFNLILNSIFREKFYQYLFNESDRQCFAVFSKLTKQAQKLYVRLFQRQYRWRQASTIKYDAISDNLVPVLDELTTMKLVQNQDDMDDLREALDVLSAPDVKELAKKYCIKADAQKTSLVESLIKLTKKPTIGSFFGHKSTDIGKKMLSEALSMLGPCYRLLEEPRAVFNRCLSLFSLTSTAYEDEEPQQQQQLYVMLQVDRGTQKYPVYTENRQTRIYPDRAALVAFQEALSLEGKVNACLEKNLLDEAVELHKKVEERYKEYWEREAQLNHDLSLPRFLQPFTAGNVYVRTLSKGVDVLQKQRNYAGANTLLEKLIEQNLYRTPRGVWYERLALNLDSHLKQQSKALDVIGRALDDEEVKVGRRLALYQRAEKICNSKSHKSLKPRLDSFSHPKLHEIPSVTIVGQKMTTTAGKTNKSSFIRRSASANPSRADDVIVCSVEEVALAHYKDQGYNKGIHGEGSTLMTLLMLYFWDIVFDSSIPDVFYNRYQTAPLDLFTDDFYQNRRQNLDARLLWIENSDTEQLTEELEESWNLHRSVACFGLHSARFQTVEEAKSLVRCIGGPIMSLIFRRHLEQMRHCRSGVPDLIVWNTNDHIFRVVEVKGPGDRLSTKQILWLDYLLRIGVQAEVCHVEGRGTKRLKKVATSPPSSKS